MIEKEIIKYTPSFLIIIIMLFIGILIGITLGIFKNRSYQNLENNLKKELTKKNELLKISKDNNLIYKNNIKKLFETIPTNKIKNFCFNYENNKKYKFINILGKELKIKPDIFVYLNNIKYHSYTNFGYYFDYDLIIKNDYFEVNFNNLDIQNNNLEFCTIIKIND